VTHSAPRSRCPTLPLPATQQEFMATRSANYRKKLGEYQRRCQRRFDASLRLSHTADDVRSDLRTLQELHRARWGSRSRAFQSGRYTAFHQEFAVLAHERGWLRLYSLDSRQRTMAILYCFLYRGRYYFYQAGRDPQFAKERVGLVLMHLVIQQAIAERAEIFDFLSGREQYKFRWAEGETRSDRLVYWRNRAAQASSLCRQAFAMVGGFSTGGPPYEG
jgi:CelD/BcsL family acetyltransferase involved in cellulose biosynthesis